jgi:hypothetical protein
MLLRHKLRLGEQHENKMLDCNTSSDTSNITNFVSGTYCDTSNNANFVSGTYCDTSNITNCNSNTNGTTISNTNGTTISNTNCDGNFGKDNINAWHQLYN